MTVEGLFHHHARYRAAWDQSCASSLCSRLGIRRASVFGDLSRGEARSVQLVAALAHRPPVLLLDEMASGLDPLGRELRKAPNASVCGRTREVEGRLQRFDLAGVRFHPPPARFTIPGTFNAGDDEDLAGTIGRAFLERFTVIFDHPGRRVAFLQSRGPSPFPPGEPGGAFPD